MPCSTCTHADSPQQASRCRNRTNEGEAAPFLTNHPPPIPSSQARHHRLPHHQHERRAPWTAPSSHRHDLNCKLAVQQFSQFRNFANGPMSQSLRALSRVALLAPMRCARGFLEAPVPNLLPRGAAGRRLDLVNARRAVSGAGERGWHWSHRNHVQGRRFGGPAVATYRTAAKG